jgi:two-component system, LytTR family, sensor kinase
MSIPATTSAPPGNSRALYALWALFWLLMFVVAIEDNRSDPGIKFWQPLVWEGSSCLVGTIWLLLQRKTSARWNHLLPEPLRWFARHLAWFPIIAVTFTVSIYGIRHGVYALTGDTYEHPPWAYLFFYESVKLLLFMGLWLGIIFGLASYARWGEERERLLALQKHLAESQLASLKAQLQPHFLFNALNTISALMPVDLERADRMLARLADLLRASLRTSARQTIALSEEIETLELYSSIMQERFAPRVSIAWNIAADTRHAAIPAMLLQPLLENAFKHGVERVSEPVAIAITTQRVGDDLQVTIHNTGKLDDAGPAGIGMRNCRERLELLHGARASLALASDARGVTATVHLPFEPAK